ncbi:MAG: archease [Planctomycetota bacterium]|jgi:SHS2 domain-containing protein
MHETFEHTADLGLRIRAGDVAELLAEAGCALMEVLVLDPDARGADTAERIAVEADGAPDLLFDWLSELLYLFCTKRFVAREYELSATETSVTATVRGWRFDPDRDRGGNEVKAITYHRLRAEETADGWLAEVILDI